MARLASLIAAVAGAAIAFTTGWILGYVLAPMEDEQWPVACPVCGWTRDLGASAWRANWTEHSHDGGLTWHDVRSDRGARALAGMTV